MNDKKFYPFFLILFSFLILAGSCHAQTSRPLEVSYPTLTLPGGEQINITQGTGLPEYVLYVYKFGMFFGFLTAILSLIVAGALYILSPAIPSLRTKAKDRIFGAVTGTIFLVLIYLIISTINPELRILKAPEVISVIPSTPFTPIASGINFYKGADCSDDSIYSSTPLNSSIRDLSDARKTLNGLKIIPDDQLNILYFAITHDLINFKGYCQYFYENDSACKRVDPFVSVSIYQYKEVSTGDASTGSVIFYREPSYNTEGGWLQINNETIIGGENLYDVDLKELTFNGDGGSGSDCTVPKEKQDCAKWDLNNKCVEYKCPTLSGENISSIKINGDYIVVLLHWDPIAAGDDETKWSACQVFPTVDDVNKKGPKQIKWEYIQSRDNLPNEVIIIAVKKK